MNTLPRLLFLHPKTLFDSWPMPVDTLGEVIKVPSIVYPLLASTIHDLPLEIEIFDGYVTRKWFSEYKALLHQANYIAITVMSPLKALDTQATILLAKRLNPAVKIILGGNQATAFPERWLANGADYIIVREGEWSFRMLMERLLERSDQLDGIPGLVYKNHAGKPVGTEPQMAYVDLDESVIPSWELLNLHPYGLGLRTGGLTATIEISRGCPFRCDFCNINKYWGYQQRYKSVPRVLEELERLHRLGVRELMIADDNFGFDYEHSCALLEELIRRAYGFRFGAFVRADTIYRHPEFAALAARAGLRLALVGIETLDRNWLKNHRKGVRSKQDPTEVYTQVYTTLRSQGVFLLGLFINAKEPNGANTPSGEGLDGRVCDFHYSADLIPQKNSALYEKLVGDESVALKDMFYHDWNLPSMKTANNGQKNHKSLSMMLRRLDPFAARALVSREPMLRRFWWRHLGISAERLLCTSIDDLRRYRWAKDERLDYDERQRKIVHSIVNPRTIQRLTSARRWKAPLALRTAF
jgi:anaerobic magnesium-protoporphyrin IX monomethyl ester cyclase